MSDQLLPDFDGPRDADPAPAPPKRSRRKPTKKKTRAAPTSKPAKRVAKKRRTRKPVQYGTAAQKAAAGHAFAAQQIIDEMKMDFVSFIETIFGFKLESWQVRLIKALEQKQK